MLKVYLFIFNDFTRAFYKVRLSNLYKMEKNI